MHELSQEDNNRCYDLEQDLLQIGDACVGIAGSDLHSVQAQELRTQGLTLLENARAILERMYEVELEEAKRRAANNETRERKAMN